jgi:hypothetical protein
MTRMINPWQKPCNEKFQAVNYALVVEVVQQLALLAIIPNSISVNYRC